MSGKKKDNKHKYFGRTVSGTNTNRPWHKRDPSPGQIGTRPGTNRTCSVWFHSKIAIFCLLACFRPRKKGINIKNFARNPPPRPPLQRGPRPLQILYVWGLLSLQNTGKSPNIKNFGGGGVLGGPKFFMLKFFACFICSLLLPRIVGLAGDLQEKLWGRFRGISGILPEFPPQSLNRIGRNGLCAMNRKW